MRIGFCLLRTSCCGHLLAAFRASAFAGNDIILCYDVVVLQAQISLLKLLSEMYDDETKVGEDNVVGRMKAIGGTMWQTNDNHDGYGGRVG